MEDESALVFGAGGKRFALLTIAVVASLMFLSFGFGTLYSFSDPVIPAGSSLSNRFVDEFHLMGLMFSPVGLAVVEAFGVIAWAIRSRITNPLRRSLAISAVAVAALIPTAGLGVYAATLLLYQLPLAATAIYVSTSRRPSLLRVSCVALMMVTLGVAIFFVGSSLLGAQTD